MKKYVSFLLIAILLVSTVSLAAGCNFIFNDGSADELIGIYGLESFTYRDKSSTVNKYGNQYDYYLVIIRDGTNATIMSKRVDGEEVSYDTTFTTTFGSGDNSTKVLSIQLANMKVRDFTYNISSKTVSDTTVTKTISLNFYPKREDLVFKENSLTKSPEGALRTVRKYVEFNKISDKVTDEKIAKAKKKQIDNREKRDADESAADEEEEEGAE